MGKQTRVGQTSSTRGLGPAPPPPPLTGPPTNLEEREISNKTKNAAFISVIIRSCSKTNQLRIELLEKNFVFWQTCLLAFFFLVFGWVLLFWKGYHVRLDLFGRVLAQDVVCKIKKVEEEFQFNLNQFQFWNGLTPRVQTICASSASWFELPPCLVDKPSVTPKRGRPKINFINFIIYIKTLATMHEDRHLILHLRNNNNIKT